jgi:hypothetical protein
MQLSDRQRARIVREFSDEYWIDDCICSIGIGATGRFNPDAPEDKKREPCIAVGMQRELPPGKELPKEYKGIAVYTHPDGPAKPLKAQ